MSGFSDEYLGMLCPGSTVVRLRPASSAVANKAVVMGLIAHDDVSIFIPSVQASAFLLHVGSVDERGASCLRFLHASPVLTVVDPD